MLSGGMMAEKSSMYEILNASLEGLSWDEERAEIRTWPWDTVRELYKATEVDKAMDLCSLAKTHWPSSLVPIIEKALSGDYDSIEHSMIELDGDYERSPRWQSGIDKLDDETDGLYGLSVIGGDSGVGKSIFAINSSVYAAMQGWRVIYFNAELKKSELQRRLSGSMSRLGKDCLKRWHFRDVFQGVTLDQMIESSLESILHKDDKILFVFDSINSIVRKMQNGSSDSGYFRNIDRICAFGESVVRKSDGHIGVMGISELSQGGYIKGATTEYVCDFSVRLNRYTEKQKGATLIRTEKGREGGGYQEYGVYMPDHLTCSFTELEEVHNEETGARYHENV
jgi:predicted ATP-dependent serine protease